MTRMSSSPSSRWVALLVATTVLFAAVTPAVAAAAPSTQEENAPSNPAVGDEVSVTYTITELYSNYDEWTLTGETALGNATWTVVWYDQSDSRLDRETFNGESFEATVAQQDPDLDAEPAKIEVRLTGDVPEIEDYSYRPHQRFELATLTESQQGGTSETLVEAQTKYHDAESEEARAAIKEAENTINESADAGADVSEAEETLTSAISSYDNENFDNAINLSNQAAETAKQAKQKKQSSEQTTTLLMYGGGAVLALLVVGGGVYWYRQNQDDDYGKLS
jgi:hypothetical protein